MAITEESRHQLYQTLSRALGENEATTLMEHLPPVGWAEVATKRDLDQMQVLAKRDLDAAQLALHAGAMEFRAEVQATTVELRSEIRATKAELRSEIQGVKAELRSEMQEMGAGLSLGIESLRSDMYAQQRNMLMAMIGANGFIAALAVAATRIV